MRASTVIGLLLVLIGLLYVLGDLNLVHLPNTLLTAGVLWPLVPVVIGMMSFRHFDQCRIPWFSLWLIVLGLTLSIRNSGYVPALQHVSAWGITWALVFVFFGLHLLTPRQKRKSPVKFSVGQHEMEVDVEDIADAFRNYGKSDSGTARKWVGDISIGRTAWALRDLSLWNYVGDIRVNLATAHIEDGVHHVKIGGWIGDVRVLVPHHLPVSVHARVGLGEVVVFDSDSSGSGREIVHVDPEFAEADKKVVIDMDLKIGEVQVVRI